MMHPAARRITSILRAEAAKHNPEPGMSPMEAVVGYRMSPAETDDAERHLMAMLQQYLDKPITPQHDAAIVETVLKFAREWTWPRKVMRS